jgi:hypothetical protein
MFNQFNIPPNLNQNLKKAKTKERLQTKLAKRKEKSPK